MAGGATALASGVLSGNLNLKDIVRGALSGALTAGLISSLGEALEVTSDIGKIALRTTVQGGVQALLGGSFKDGAIAGFACGLADLATTNLNNPSPPRRRR